MLSELGAEVVKIESAGKMDNLRFTGLGDPNRGFAFNAEARGRAGVTLDLTLEEAADWRGNSASLPMSSPRTTGAG